MYAYLTNRSLLPLRSIQGEWSADGQLKKGGQTKVVSLCLALTLGIFDFVYKTWGASEKIKYPAPGSHPGPGLCYISKRDNSTPWHVKPANIQWVMIGKAIPSGLPL